MDCRIVSSSPRSRDSWRADSRSSAARLSSEVVISLNASPRTPISSAWMTGTRAVRSPCRTCSAAAVRSRIGRVMREPDTEEAATAKSVAARAPRNSVLLTVLWVPPRVWGWVTMRAPLTTWSGRRFKGATRT